MSNGKELEEYVRNTYQFLLNMKDEGLNVEKDKKLVGKSGAVHQIDVYYEFVFGNRIHHVAIECKDYSSAVDKGRVQEFALKLQDIGNISGEMVSANGYQSGAKKIAEHYDINLKTINDLPTMPHLLGMRLSSVALPDESYKAEPFWTIMELRNDKVTGSYFGHTQDGRKFIPLFFSKYHALMYFQESNLDTKSWGIRGLPRHALRAFILMLDLLKRQSVEPMIMFRPPGDTSNSGFAGFVTDRKLLAKEYYCGEVPEPVPDSV
ncbi:MULTISPECIES: restriction endonuclease [unclassified Endozoicomonas]|uniref:restriction endonuclease n=1 Tax=unclassified Endozoicomonas TaxID=2644528 RepID=UPI003BB4D68D